MTGLRLVLSAVAGSYQKAFKAIETPIAKAATATIDDAKAQVLSEGRANIAGAGFGSKWQNALRGTRYPRTGTSIEAAAWIFHRIPYAAVFETGARIPGSPLLWLPLPGVPQKIGGRRMSPRNYIALVGPLHTIRVAGKNPLLAAYMRGKAGSKVTLGKLRAGAALQRLGVRASRSDLGRAGLVSVPLFVGIPSVQLHKRFDLTGVFNHAVSQLGANYLRHIGSGS